MKGSERGKRREKKYSSGRGENVKGGNGGKEERNLQICE